MDIYEYSSPTAPSEPDAEPDAGPTQPELPPATQTPPATQATRASTETAPNEGVQTQIGRRIRLGSVASDREILLRGRRAFDRGEDASALESLDRLRSHGVRFADVHYMLGMLHERSGDLDASLASLREAIRINPSYVEALLALASLHERRGEYDRSQGYAERASQLSRPTAGGLDPTTRGKLANQQAALADALAEAGERRDAIEQYRRALDRCPTFHDVRHRLGIVLREAGLPAQAAAEFARILRTHPGMLESQIQLGLTYYSMGRTPEAVREWDAVLEKDPSRDEARMYLRLVGATGSATPRTNSDATMQPEPQPEPQSEPESGLSFQSIPQAPSIPSPQNPAAGWSTTELVGHAGRAGEDAKEPDA